MQRYAASVTQFRRVMQRKIDKSCRHHTDQDAATCAGLLDALVEKFVRAGLLNDEGFARGSVISLRRRGLSQRMILMKLQNKGLSEQQVKAALAEFNDDNETSDRALELEGALKLAKKKKFGPFAGGAEYDRKKALGAFARAGFSMDVIRKVLDMDLEEIED
jgi:regulatory protein